MAEAKKETPKEPPKVITVYNGTESAEIMETDLKVWIAKGYTTDKPSSSLTPQEKAILLKRAMANVGMS